MACHHARSTRLEALLAKARAQAKHLRTELLDAPKGSAARAAIRRRHTLVERRIRGLSDLDRRSRRNAKTLSA
jgi:hypothetical protein